MYKVVLPLLIVTSCITTKEVDYLDDSITKLRWRIEEQERLLHNVIQGSIKQVCVYRYLECIKTTPTVICEIDGSRCVEYFK
jgi:hypothetical protein